MKFVHIADMHFDSPFVNLSEKDIMGDLRRLEQRKVFKKIIEYIKENNIKYFFISGDLYEHKYIKQSTIDYINKLFEEIPETNIYIAPGNHDPYTKNSYYNKYNWSKNVKIFGPKVEKIETQDANIYGYGFDDFYCSDSGVENIEIEQTEKPNILIIHGNIDGSTIEDMQYNSMSKKMLQEKGFDYVALGHIHKKDYNTEENQKINELEIEENNYVEIILIGNRNFEINKYDLIKYILNNNIIKIKDNTKIAYNLEKLENENTLKGLFIKEMNKKLKNAETEEEKEIIEKSIEIGLASLE